MKVIVIIGLLVASTMHAVTHGDLEDLASRRLPNSEQRKKSSRRAQLAELVAVGDAKRAGLQSGSAYYDDNWRNNNFEEDKPTYCDCISGCLRAARVLVVASAVGISAIVRGACGLSDGAPIQDGLVDMPSLTDLYH